MVTAPPYMHWSVHLPSSAGAPSTSTSYFPSIHLVPNIGVQGAAQQAARLSVSLVHTSFLLVSTNRFRSLSVHDLLSSRTSSRIRAASAQTPQELAFLEYAKAVNADRYRVTVIKMGEDGTRKVFILDKKDGQSMGFTPDELVQKIPELLKFQNRGENIYYTPLSEDKHHILLDDVSPENVVRLQKDGYKPAAIIESSPRNFQCILTIPKFGGEFDRQIANQLTAMLNKEYGDTKLSGAIHPHRAPGFENRKPKHRRENGSYPLVFLRHAIQHRPSKNKD